MLTARRNLAPKFNLGFSSRFSRLFNRIEDPQVRADFVRGDDRDKFVGSIFVSGNAANARFVSFPWPNIPHIFLMRRYAKVGAAVIKRVPVQMINNKSFGRVSHDHPVKQKRLSVFCSTKSFLGGINKWRNRRFHDGSPTKIGKMGVFIINDGFVAATKVDLNHFDSLLAVSHQFNRGRV